MCEDWDLVSLGMPGEHDGRDGLSAHTGNRSFVEVVKNVDAPSVDGSERNIP